MKLYFKSAVLGVFVGLSYAITSSVIIGVYPIAILQRLILFAIIGFFMGVIYCYLVIFCRKKFDATAIKKKIIISNGFSSLFSVFICGVSFYLLNVLFLANSSSSKELFMISVHKLTFEIFIYFTLFNLFINLIRGILEMRKINCVVPSKRPQ
jgi:hypothetical protein